MLFCLWWLASATHLPLHKYCITLLFASTLFLGQLTKFLLKISIFFAQSLNLLLPLIRLLFQITFSTPTVIFRIFSSSITMICKISFYLQDTLTTSSENVYSLLLNSPLFLNFSLFYFHSSVIKTSLLYKFLSKTFPISGKKNQIASLWSFTAFIHLVYSQNAKVITSPNVWMSNFNWHLSKVLRSLSQFDICFLKYFVQSMHILIISHFYNRLYLLITQNVTKSFNR